MKKKLLAVLIGGVMVMTCLFGCGKSDKNTVAKNDDVTTENAEETTKNVNTEETTTEKEEIQSTKAPEEDTPIEYEIIQKDCYYYIGGDEYDSANTLSAGDVMPLQPQDGDVYETPDYLYVYMESKSSNYPSGWEVISTDTSKYGEIREVIASEPVVYMIATFWAADELVEAPAIPDTVEYMIGTFTGADNLKTVPNLPNNLVEMTAAFFECDNLEEVPEIPSSVEIMDIAFYYSGIVNAPNIPANVRTMVATFGECSKLTGEIVFDANPEDYIGCFMNVDFIEQNLTFAGKTNLEPELRASRNDTGYISDYDVKDYYDAVMNEIMTGEMASQE